jgi:hypothetical protein
MRMPHGKIWRPVWKRFGVRQMFSASFIWNSKVETYYLNSPNSLVRFGCSQPANIARLAGSQVAQEAFPNSTKTDRPI